MFERNQLGFYGVMRTVVKSVSGWAPGPQKEFSQLDDKLLNAGHVCVASHTFELFSAGLWSLTCGRCTEAAVQSCMELRAYTCRGSITAAKLHGVVHRSFIRKKPSERTLGRGRFRLSRNIFWNHP